MSEGIDIFFRQMIDEDGFAGTGDGSEFPEPVAVARSSRLDIFVAVFLDEKCREGIPSGFGLESAIPGLVDIAEVVARFGSSEIIDADGVDIAGRGRFDEGALFVVRIDEFLHAFHILTPVIIGIGDIAVAIF